MNNSEKYHFSDFTHANYARLLKLAAEHHVFRHYHDIQEGENYVLWRHDIDMSVDNALALSTIEKQHGAVATYFVHLHSDYYNFMDQYSYKKLSAIIDNGHELALHFDPGFYNISSQEELTEKLALEKHMLEKLFGIEVKVFSFHNPTEPILSFDDLRYAGMINTYSHRLKQIAYCSDSNGYWRHKSIYDTLLASAESPVQVLTHPEWWTERVSSPKERVWACIDNKADELKGNYDANLKKYDRQNIDWN